MDPFFASDGRLRPGWRFVLALLLMVFAHVTAYTLAGLLAAEWHAFQAIFRTLLMVFVVGGFCVLLINTDGVRGRLLAAQGLGRTPTWARDAGMGVAIGAGMIGFAVLAVWLLGGLSFAVTLTAETLLLALVQLWILAAGAMGEEAMLRGYAFQRLIEAVGTVFAIVVLSVLFSALHLTNPHASVWSWGFLNTAAVGVVFAVAYLRTRALWLPWGMHFGWNFMLGVGFGLPVSGLTQFAVVVQGAAAGPAWLTGGSYGLEDSVTGFAAILAGLGAVLLLTRGHPAGRTRTHLPDGYVHPGGSSGIQAG